MVDPDARRRGIGRALVDAALPIVKAHGVERILAVVPRPSAAGQEFCRSFGMTYEHSEHGLRLDARPDDTPREPELSLRQASVEDIPKLSDLFRDGFGDDGYVDPARLAGERSRTLMITQGDETVGTIALARDGARGAIYGFVVESGRRGSGIGRRAPRCWICNDPFDAGADYVERGRGRESPRTGLATSVGFSLLATDDYYELML